MPSYTPSDPLVAPCPQCLWTHSRKRTRLAARCLEDELEAEESPSFRGASDLLELPLIPLFLHCQETPF